MPNRFCAICGSELDEESPHFGMCLKCYLEEHPLFELPSSFSVNICIDCRRYSKKELWNEPKEDDFFSILLEILQKLFIQPLLKNVKINFSLSLMENSILYSSRDLVKSVEVQVTGRLKKDPNIFHQQHVKLNLNQMLCKTCSNLRAGTYFISILQLRIKDETQFDLIDKVLKEIHEFTENLFEKDHRQYISKIEDQKYGVDLYLSTNEIMNQLVKFLKGNYHFLVKRTKKLVGRDKQKGKNLYRLKSLVKFLPVGNNDVILIDNQDFIVESIKKDKIILKSKDNIRLIKDYSFFFNENIIKKD
ncbi:MAG: NMD3-related protein [Promethearchaeota archaeon]|jgi:NMD protein affecting ribosome stability and mRNA decay